MVENRGIPVHITQRCGNTAPSLQGIVRVMVRTIHEKYSSVLFWKFFSCDDTCAVNKDEVFLLYTQHGENGPCSFCMIFISHYIRIQYWIEKYVSITSAYDVNYLVSIVKMMFLLLCRYSVVRADCFM